MSFAQSPDSFPYVMIPTCTVCEPELFLLTSLSRVLGKSNSKVSIRWGMCMNTSTREHLGLLSPGVSMRLKLRCYVGQQRRIAHMSSSSTDSDKVSLLGQRALLVGVPRLTQDLVVPAHRLPSLEDEVVPLDLVLHIDEAQDLKAKRGPRLSRLLSDSDSFCYTSHRSLLFVEKRRSDALDLLSNLNFEVLAMSRA
eukprot:765149-Hanusia_phi.AAC.1